MPHKPELTLAGKIGDATINFPHQLTVTSHFDGTSLEMANFCFFPVKIDQTVFFNEPKIKLGNFQRLSCPGFLFQQHCAPLCKIMSNQLA